MSNEITFQELFVSAYIFVQKNFKLLLIFFIIGVSIGLVRHFLLKPKYESRMTAMSRLETDLDFENIRQYHTKYYSGELAANKIRNFSKALEYGNYKYLSEELGISEDSIQLLSSISINFLYPISGTEAEEDLEEIDYFEINVEVGNNDILPKLEKGIAHSIRNDDFISQKVEFSKRITQELIAEIESEMAELDSLQKLEEKLLSQQPQGFIIFNGSPLQSNKVALFAKKVKFEKILNEYTAFEPVTGFVASQKDKNGLVKNVIVFAFVLTLLGFVFILFRDLSRLAAKREQKK